MAEVNNDGKCQNCGHKSHCHEACEECHNDICGKCDCIHCSYARDD